MLEEFKQINAIGQLCTTNGEEILCTTNVAEEASELNRLTTAFVEADVLAHSLKLGSVKRIISFTSTEEEDQSKKIVTVQSRVDDQSTGSALLSTVVGSSLQECLVADGIMKQTTQQIL
jgi:hypothetical protein